MGKRRIFIGDLQGCREELEDLLIVAVNRAMDRADAEAAKAMHGVTGGMLPGLMG